MCMVAASQVLLGGRPLRLSYERNGRFGQEHVCAIHSRFRRTAYGGVLEASPAGGRQKGGILDIAWQDVSYA